MATTGRKTKAATPDRTMDEQAMMRKKLASSLMAMNSIVSRASLSGHLGKGYGGDRDLYQALGYPATITFEDYLAKYRRGGYSRRIINAYPKACWKVRPKVYDDDDPVNLTPFETDWEDMVKRLGVWNILQRADTLAGIGRYGGILLGFDDSQDIAEPVGNGVGRTLLYATPLTEGQLEIVSKDTDTTSERYGLPEIYRLRMDESSMALPLHWSRVVHVVDNMIDSDIYGSPRLEPVFNNIMDLEKLTGGSAEMFWRGAFPGMGFLMDSEADVDNIDLDALQTEIDNYIHNLNRYMKLQGMTIQQLSPQVSDPKSHVDIQLMEIAAATEIPKRILTGTEEAKLAGGQDADQWRDQVEARRLSMCEERILRPFIDRLLDAGALSPTKDESYSTDWSEGDTNPMQTVTIAKDRVLMMRDYIQSGLEVLMPPEIFLGTFIGLDASEIEEIMDSVNLADMTEAREAREEEAAMEKAKGFEMIRE